MKLSVSAWLDNLWLARAGPGLFRRRELGRMPDEYDGARAFLYGTRRAALGLLTEVNRPRLLGVDVLASHAGGILFALPADHPLVACLDRQECALIITASCCGAAAGARLTLEARHVTPAAPAEAARLRRIHPHLAGDGVQALRAELGRARWLPGTGPARWLDGARLAPRFRWRQETEWRALSHINRLSAPGALLAAPDDPARAVLLDPAGLWLRAGERIRRLNFCHPLDHPRQALARLRYRCPA